MTRPMPLEDIGWHDDAVNMITAYAESGLDFTAEDLRRSIRPAPNPNDYGAAFRAACQTGLIAVTGYKESSEPSRKGGLIRIWKKKQEQPE